MRIAVPVSNDRTAETLSGIEGFQFFEDDHGRIVRRFFVPRAGEGAAAAVARDPNNKCNACGFQSSCSLSGKGGCGRD